MAWEQGTKLNNSLARHSIELDIFYCAKNYRHFPLNSKTADNVIPIQSNCAHGMFTFVDLFTVLLLFVYLFEFVRENPTDFGCVSAAYNFMTIL